MLQSVGGCVHVMPDLSSQSIARSSSHGAWRFPHPANTALSHMQEASAPQEGSPEPRGHSPAAQHYCNAATPPPCTAPSAPVATSAPYSMIPPTDRPIAVPAFRQSAAASAPSAECPMPAGSDLRELSPSTASPAHLDLQAPAAGPVHGSRRSNVGSPSAFTAGSLGLSGTSSQHAPAAAEGPPLVLPLLAWSSSMPEESLQRHASCPPCSQQPACGPQDLKTLVLTADMRSSSSLPMPDTPAAAEELRCRLMHHSSSLSQADLLRPGSAGSDDGALLEGLAHALQPPLHKSGQRRIVIPLTAEAQGQAHKPGRLGGMLGKWTAGAVSRSVTPPCQCPQQPQQRQSSFVVPKGRAGEACLAAKVPLDHRCSPVESEPDQAGLLCGPRAKASAQ